MSEAGGSGLEARRTYEALKEESRKWVEFRDIYISFMLPSRRDHRRVKVEHEGSVLTEKQS